MSAVLKIVHFILLCTIGAYCVDYHALLDYVESDEPFPLLDISMCNASIPKCMKHLQEHAQSCVEQWKRESGAKYDECMNKPAMKHCYGDWKEASTKWYSNFQKCLIGGSPPAETQATVKTSRFRRDHHEGHHGHAHSHGDHSHSHGHGSDESEEDLHANHSMHYQNHVECFKALKEHKARCSKKYETCEKYVQCSGFGKEPTNQQTAKAWFTYMQKLRNTTMSKAHTHFKHLSLCLVGAATGNEPDHAKGGHEHDHSHHGHHRF